MAVWSSGGRLECDYGVGALDEAKGYGGNEERAVAFFRA